MLFSSPHSVVKKHTLWYAHIMWTPISQFVVTDHILWFQDHIPWFLDHILWYLDHILWYPDHILWFLDIAVPARPASSRLAGEGDQLPNSRPAPENSRP